MVQIDEFFMWMKYLYLNARPWRKIYEYIFSHIVSLTLQKQEVILQEMR
jgi:hypothetical protein